MKMPVITEQGMVDGVKKSAFMIVLLTPGMMDRPFCHLEIRTAIANDVGFVGIYESDERRGVRNFVCC